MSGFKNKIISEHVSYVRLMRAKRESSGMNITIIVSNFRVWLQNNENKKKKYLKK